MKFSRWAAQGGAVALLLVGAGAVASAGAFSVTATKFAQAPAIDGVLDDAAWVQASANDSKVVQDINNTGDTLSAFPRTVYVGYDANNLYIGMSAPVSDAGKLTQASSVWNSDEEELFVQPNLNDPTFYHLGVDFKGTISGSEGSPDVSKVKLATKVNATSWTLEMAIPFSVYGVTPKAGDTWGVGIDGHQIGEGDLWIAWRATGGAFAQTDKFGQVVFGE